jgi:hypothetical protein
MYSYFAKLNQSFFGHMALKPTKLYIFSKNDIGENTVCVDSFFGNTIAVKIKISDLFDLRDLRGLGNIKPCQNLSRSQRESTPANFAKFLIDIAKLCG